MKKILIYIFIVIALTTQVTHAQSSSEYELLEPLPCVQDTGNNCAGGQTISKINLDTYIGYIFKFSIALAVFLAAVMIIWGGFEYMISEVPSAKTNAKGRITNAILGLLGALVSYLILVTIDPRLVQVKTQLDPVCPPGQAVKGSLCDTSAVTEYKKQLAQQIIELNIDDQNKILNSQTKIDTLSAQRKELARQCEEGFIDDEDTCMREIAKLDGQIRKEKSEQIKVEAVGTSRNLLIEAFNVMDNPELYTEYNGNSREKTIDKVSQQKINAINGQIEEKFYQYTSRLEEIHDLTTLQNLEQAKTNLRNIIVDEQKIMNVITKSVKKEEFLTNADKKFLENELNKAIKMYDPKTYAATDLFAENSRQIANRRISRIKNVLYPCATGDCDIPAQ